MKTFALAALAATAVNAIDNSDMLKFTQFVAKYGKTYDHWGDYQFRMFNFLKNDALIEEHNASESNYKLGHNSRSDWSQGEWESILGRREKSFKHSKVTAPPQQSNGTGVDWRDQGVVNPIQDQGQCGSCWAFSAVQSTESAHALASGTLLKFAEQQLVDCVQLCFGCNGGFEDKGMDYYERHGAILESDYAYTATDGSCQYSSLSNTGVNTSGHIDYSTSDADSMKAAVESNPISVAIQANQFAFQLYSSGVFDNTNCGTQLDHAVGVVGWGTDATAGDYWIMRNSWGTSWGEDGYMRMAIVDGDGICGIQMEPSAPTGTN